MVHIAAMQRKLHVLQSWFGPQHKPEIKTDQIELMPISLNHQAGTRFIR